MNEQDFVQAEARRRIDADIDKRIKVHKANIARLEASRASAKALGAKVSARPLVMLAQGDSWFDYPLTGNGLPFVDTDVIAQLRRIGDTQPVVLNLAHYGEAATDEMSLPKQERMITVLRDKSNWPDGKPDAILFSAGGNDIAGDQFCIFLDFNDGHAPGLNADRFAKALGMVEACYLDMFAFRDRLAPGVPVVGHCYDFPIPNGAHPACAGPWLKPSLDFCNWPLAQGRQIVHDALAAFRVMLKRLESDSRNNFIMVDTQGVLTPNEWANELHPEPGGFKKFAQKFADTLQKLNAQPPAKAQSPAKTQAAAKTRAPAVAQSENSPRKSRAAKRKVLSTTG
jgi:hypothetical protein